MLASTLYLKPKRTKRPIVQPVLASTARTTSPVTFHERNITKIPATIKARIGGVKFRVFAIVTRL